MSIYNPCTPDCPERTPTCHTYCGRYIAFEETCKKFRRLRLELNIIDSPGPEKIRNTRRKLNKYHK